MTTCSTTSARPIRGGEAVTACFIASWALLPNLPPCDVAVFHNTGLTSGLGFRWLIDRGDGSGLASVSLVILSFVQPMKLLNKTNDAGDVNGVLVGMNAAVVNYFKSHNARVMLSVGGITDTSFWEQALSSKSCAIRVECAAATAQSLGVGVEIDHENSSIPILTGSQAFVKACPVADSI